MEQENEDLVSLPNDQVAENSFSSISDQTDKITSAKKSCIEDINLISSMTFNRRTLKEWTDYFHMRIPTNPVVKDIYLLLSKNNENLNELNRLISQSSLARDLHENALKAKKSARFVEIKKGNVKYTVDQINSLLDVEFADDDKKRTIHNFLVEFFNRIQGQTIGTRKAIESIAYSLNSELKTFGKAGLGGFDTDEEIT